MDLVLFKDALEHVCRIHRILRQPRGNALLVGIGGSGRKSLARLATFMTGCHLFQIEIRKNFREHEFREKLKELYPIIRLFNLLWSHKIPQHINCFSCISALCILIFIIILFSPFTLFTPYPFLKLFPHELAVYTCRYFATGVEGKNTVFLFSDTQIITESFLEDVTNILSSGEVCTSFSRINQALLLGLLS
jgi:hypothetical protein